MLSMLALWSVMVVIAALVTTVLSAIAGTAIAFYARPVFIYGLMLGMLFLPFAIGGSVWAFAMRECAIVTGLQECLLYSTALSRAVAVLCLCLARSVPLGAFFCATSLQRYAITTRGYFDAHKLGFSFFQAVVLRRIPRSILVLLGIFGGAIVASEGSLPLYLYRANPGTGPEGPNIFLGRVFRENYGSADSSGLLRIAITGVGVSIVLLVASTIGALVARLIVSAIARIIHRGSGRTSISAHIYVFLVMSSTATLFLPGCLIVVGLLMSTWSHGIALLGVGRILGEYIPMCGVATVVALAITAVSLVVAMKLRFSRRDVLAWLERRALVAAALLFPAFWPVLTVIAMLGTISTGRMSGVVLVVSLMFCHAVLHYSIFQFICISLVSGIPKAHVAWQRSVQMRFRFSLWVDGVLRHSAVLSALVGLGFVQVLTDGATSRWFDAVVRAPEESLYAAVFGRLSSAGDAVAIVWTIAIMAIGVCAILARGFLKDLCVGVSDV